MNNTEMLLSPLISTTINFSNRIVMAPMNRRRAERGVPSASAITYFSQRVDAGLILTDNTAISPNGIGYLDTPAIYNHEQVEAWKKVTEAVHSFGGKIFLQLVHAGRIGHVENNEENLPLVAPSVVPANDTVLVKNKGHLPISTPIALNNVGIKEVIDQHVLAAKKAMVAGFDGVEVHGAHGFLAEQFLHPYTNRRTDQYGGSIINRARFLLEIVDAVASAIGQDRTGVRLSPYLKYNDLPPYEEELVTHQYLSNEFNKIGILYIHLSNNIVNGVPAIPDEYIRDIRGRFKNFTMLAGNFTGESAEIALKTGLADMIAFGRPFIANPDFVNRIKKGYPLAEPEEGYFYRGGDKGYIDYSNYEETI